MPYIYKWIEGEKNLSEFCAKRFHAEPVFIENIGRCGDAKIYKRYKQKGDRWVDFYLLFMNHPKGGIYDINDKSRMTYEEIKADRTSILVK